MSDDITVSDDARRLAELLAQVVHDRRCELGAGCGTKAAPIAREFQQAIAVLAAGYRPPGREHVPAPPG